MLLKKILTKFVDATKPFVWRLAQAYDLRVDRPLYQSGQHPLIIEDDLETARHRIPKSAYFNTRSGSIRVGRGTVFGEDVQVLTGKHMDFFEASRLGLPHHHVPEIGRDIVIGRGCYIGGGAIIVGPVEIGDLSVIGAGSVVTKNIPPGVFAAGVPARTVKPLDGGDK